MASSSATLTDHNGTLKRNRASKRISKAFYDGGVQYDSDESSSVIDPHELLEGIQVEVEGGPLLKHELFSA